MTKDYKLIKLENISKHIFWDVDRDKLDTQRNKQFIIERIFTLGDISDVKIIAQIYGIEVIKKEIVNAGYLDKKTLNWLSLFLKIPKTEFKCYTKIQSNQVHWNF